MSRIGSRFSDLVRQRRKAFIPFVTAGDPNLDVSLDIILNLAEIGADVIELGVPFTDPMADGPTIQRSSQRALGNGVRVLDVLTLVKRARNSTDVPIVLFSYLNPILRYGVENLARSAVDAGVDGVLFTDAVDDEAAEYAEIFDGVGIDLISLIAPTTTDVRLARIAKNSRGFLYAVSRAGVTGAQIELSSDAERLVRRAKAVASLPIVVGFGISTRSQIEDVWRYADGAVVGSAIVSAIEKNPDNAVAAVESFVRGLLPQFAKSGTEL